MNNIRTYKLMVMLVVAVLLTCMSMPCAAQKAGGYVKKKPTTTQKSTTTTTTTKKSGTTTQKSGGATSRNSGKTTQQKPSNPSVPKSSNRSAMSEAEKARIINNLIANMVYVEGGTFTMGATSEQGSDADSDEKAHQVTLSSYYIGRYEVTQEEWQAVMGSNPSYFKGSQCPVECVSWEDCQEFISRLNAKTGRNFRLPTEAEWEYAARGGRKSNGYKYAGGNNIGDVAWYDGNSNDQTHDVGQKRSNELGLYDMAGNVWEWCQDWYGSYSSSSLTNPTGASTGSYRVYRGGSWNFSAGYCRVSDRGYDGPSFRYSFLGLRLAL